MEAFDWSPTTRHSNIISQITFFCEWEMNFHHPIQIQHHKEKTEQEISSGLEPVEQEEEEGGENSPSSSKAQCEWDFHLSTVVSSNSIGAISDTLGVIEFDPSNQFLATAGIARKIRIYSLNSLLHQGTTQSATGTQQQQQQQQQQQTLLLNHNTVCDFYICTPAKLSSVRWKPDTAGCVVGSGDYDGVVTEYDLERRVPVFERDEHGGRRVWSVDYSHWNRVIGASGSDDGTTQLWDTRCGTDQYISVIQPSVGRSPVCCVEFDPFGGDLIAVGCADRNAYTYDARNMLNPVSVFAGHQKTVSYVRFLGEGMMVSAGTDGCLKLWDMDSGHVIRTYKGHVNNKNFVGLSVWSNGGLIGCGSESNEVFVYDKRWGEPIWVHGLEPIFGTNSDQNRFVSSVCWKQIGEEDQCTLVAGGSDGILQVFVGRRKSSSSSSFV